ncbi:MAG TPA: hypothetical protein VHP57_02010, partial [Acidimicrobiia bacterium]|nr:hypothetical protein [Acidimicrobiia bacterium]
MGVVAMVDQGSLGHGPKAGRRAGGVALAAVVAAAVLALCAQCTLPTTPALASPGATAFVINIYGNSVTPIDVATKKAGAPIPVGSGTTSVAITPDGKTAFVTNQGSTVTPI